MNGGLVHRTEHPDDSRPRDRAMYLAALAVGLASAGLSDDRAVTELVDATGGRHGDALAARRRLYSSALGSCDSRREAARLLDLAHARTRRHHRTGPPGATGRRQER